MGLIGKINYNRLNTVRLIGIIGIVGIIIAGILGNMPMLLVIALLPIVFVFLNCSLRKPIIVWCFLFVVNYVIMGAGRYVVINDTSIIMDALLMGTLVILCINGVKNKTIKWGDLNCTLCIATAIWAYYCFLEILNPTAVTYAWFASKNLIYNPLLVSIITILAVCKRSYLRSFIYLFALLSLLAVLKTLQQRYLGFDAGEHHWLETGSGGKSTHIIMTGIRYFSIFTDASNMGSNMGYASFFFGMIGLYCSRNSARIIFFILSALCLYALVLSGTRGAVIVPIGGLAAYAVLSKSIKLMIVSTVVLIGIYVFFAMTYIGHGNANIRRMRSGFKPTKDASFMVRLENQEKFRIHLEDRWFGEGLGLSGGENYEISPRFTTSIPTDSWLVKIWVETGVVGLTLYLVLLFVIFLRCTYIILFKVPDEQVRGLFIGLLGGSFGLVLSSYGNVFFGQYPTHYIVYMNLAIITNYKYFINKDESDVRHLY